MGQVLVSDLGQRDGRDVELLPFDEMEEEVQGAFEGRQLNFILLGHKPPHYSTNGLLSNIPTSSDLWYNLVRWPRR